MMMVSDSALVARKGTLPAAVTLLPMMPMHTAMNMEITTQIVAMRRDWLSSFSSRMAIKRSRMCGMPK